MADGNTRSAEPGPVVVRLTEDAWSVLRAARLAALGDAPAAFAVTLAEAQAYDENRWRKTLRTGATFVALLDRSPVGMVAGIPRLHRDECGLGAMWVDPAWRGRSLALHVVVRKVHAAADILADGEPDRIDPDKWRPLIMSFQRFYGLAPEQVHGSELAKIPEAAYRP